MLHDIGQGAYQCEYAPRLPDIAKDYLLCYKDDLVRIARLSENENGSGWQYLFTISGAGFFLCPDAPEGEYHKLQAMRSYEPQWLAFAAVTGHHLDYWYRHSRYCGACSTALVHSKTERAMTCPRCGNILYPNIAVAVIVGVQNGDRLLLTKYAAGAYRKYALVAGYVEIGESLRDAAKREVLEETGVRIKNLRYFDDQPWGFSRSLLVGFFAELDGAEDITLQESELSEAVWMPRNEIEPQGKTITLTAKMMEAFRTMAK